MPTVKPPPFEVLSAEFVAAARRPVELPPPTKLEIAFVGKSNVGTNECSNGRECDFPHRHADMSAPWRRFNC